MDSSPLVSIICLCHNQKPFIRQALESVLQQTYPNIELLVVDDASTDGSQEEITHFTNVHPEISFVFLDHNAGNCKAFNLAFQQSRGEYIIDLSGDDILMPQRVEIGLEDFGQKDESYGIHFSDAIFINDDGETTGTHFQRNPEGILMEKVPSGDIYINLIQRYFVSAPTMMIRRKVLEDLHGYDESLTYEDFDFWIRSGRDFQYIFYQEPLIKQRILKHSHSSAQYKFRNKHQASTYRVCEKILHLNQTPEEHQALVKRCNYEMRQCLRTGNLELIWKYMKLKKAAGRQN